MRYIRSKGKNLKGNCAKSGSNVININLIMASLDARATTVLSGHVEPKYNSPQTSFSNGYVIYHTRKNMFDHISKHQEESYKYDA